MKNLIKKYFSKMRSERPSDDKNTTPVPEGFRSMMREDSSN